MDQSGPVVQAGFGDDYPGASFFGRAEDRCSHDQPGEADCSELALPGGVPDRPAEICLQTAFDEGCSPASLSALLHEAGRRAGEILQEIDHSVLGKVVQARDELFVGRDPILLMVEPHSLAITGLYATADRDAETWGCVLLFTQDRRVQIQGLAEDAVFLTLSLAKKPPWMPPFRKMCGIHWQMSAKSSMMWNARPCRS